MKLTHDTLELKTRIYKLNEHVLSTGEGYSKLLGWILHTIIVYTFYIS